LKAICYISSSARRIGSRDGTPKGQTRLRLVASRRQRGQRRTVCDCAGNSASQISINSGASEHRGGFEKEYKMKLKPKAEMKRLAIFNLVMAGILIVGDILFIYEYMKMRRLHWAQLFRTEAIHDNLMNVSAEFVFILFPVFAFLLIRNAWIIFKHLGKISD
jgi:hypothetical protein